MAAEVAALAAAEVEAARDKDNSNRQSKAKRSSSRIVAIIAAKDLSHICPYEFYLQ